MRSILRWLVIGLIAGNAASAWAFPSWMGVYGSYAPHNGSNPGTYTILMNQDYGSSRIRVGAFPSYFGSGLMNSPQNHRSKQPLGIWKTRAVTRGFHAFKADLKISASIVAHLEVRTRPQVGNVRDFHRDPDAASRTPTD